MTKTITYQTLFYHTSNHDFIQMLNEVMAGEAQLRAAHKHETVDVSFADNTFSIARARGQVFFINGELSIHNPRLMDYSVLLTHSSAPHHYRTHQTLFTFDKNQFFNERKTYKRCSKDRFCNFLYSHPIPYRNHFARQLMKRKRLDCGGYCLNNSEMVMGSYENNKQLEYLSHYKFTICIEHTRYPSYVTEKIYNALRAGSVPIYWGAPDIAHDVNPQAFINVDDFPDIDAAIDYIMKVDQNPQLYERYLQAEPLTSDSYILQDSETRLNQFYKKALHEIAQSNPVKPTWGTRLYRLFYGPIAQCHLVIADHHVDGQPLRRFLCDWHSLLRLPWTLLRKAWNKKEKMQYKQKGWVEKRSIRNHHNPK